MPAAVAVPAIVGGASALGGAAISAHAAGSAAKQQKQSADRALGLESRIYDEQKTRLQPYVDAGTSSLARLMDGYWNNKPYGMTLNVPQGQTAFMQAMGAPTAPYGAAQGAPAAAGRGGPTQPYAGPMNAAGAYQGAPASANMGAPASANVGGYGQVQVNPGGVMMKAPTGETRMVPAHLVARAEQAGAVRVQ